MRRARADLFEELELGQIKKGGLTWVYIIVELIAAKEYVYCYTVTAKL